MYKNKYNKYRNKYLNEILKKNKEIQDGGSLAIIIPASIGGLLIASSIGYSIINHEKNYAKEFNNSLSENYPDQEAIESWNRDKYRIDIFINDNPSNINIFKRTIPYTINELKNNNWKKLIYESNSSINDLTDLPDDIQNIENKELKMNLVRAIGQGGMGRFLLEKSLSLTKAEILFQKNKGINKELYNKTVNLYITPKEMIYQLVLIKSTDDMMNIDHYLNCMIRLKWNDSKITDVNINIFKIPFNENFKDFDLSE